MTFGYFYVCVCVCVCARVCVHVQGDSCDVREKRRGARGGGERSDRDDVQRERGNERGRGGGAARVTSAAAAAACSPFKAGGGPTDGQTAAGL